MAVSNDGAAFETDEVDPACWVASVSADDTLGGFTVLGC